MAKISIEEALRTKLALPWKIQDRLNTVFLVIRRRPEDLTAEIYRKLREYGLNDNSVRELFYGMPGEWATLKSKLGIEKQRGPKAKEVLGATIKGILPGYLRADKVEFGGKRAGKTSRLASTPADKLPKVAMEGTPVKATTVTSTPSTFPEAVSTNQENIDIHQPTRQEVETFFEAEASSISSLIDTDFSGWDSFADPHFDKSGVMVVGKTKFYIGKRIAAKIARWTHCEIKISPNAKRVALLEAASGFKVCRDDNRININCSGAIKKIHAAFGVGAEYVPVIEQEGLIVFEYRGKQ